MNHCESTDSGRSFVRSLFPFFFLPLVSLYSCRRQTQTKALNLAFFSRILARNLSSSAMKKWGLNSYYYDKRGFGVATIA